tara:strand:- start:4007 stop:4714 length:708 start_codon:yes stop_codon:yes gene_type:complete
MQIKNRLKQNAADIEIARKQLQTLLNTTDDILIAATKLQPLNLKVNSEDHAVEQSPLVGYLQQQLKVNEQETNVERNAMLPDLIFGYNSTTFVGSQYANNQVFTESDRFSYVQFGITIPILPGGHRSKIKAAKINEDIAQSQLELTKTTLQGQLQNLLQEYYKLQGTLQYYQNEALPQAELIIDNSEKSFKSGDVSYTQYLQNLTLTNTIQTEYLNTLYQYNQSIIIIETLMGLK